MSYVATSLSRMELRQFAIEMRKLFNVTNLLYVPIVKLLELIPFLVNGANYEIVLPDELEECEHAVTEPFSRTIKIRQDVYDNACKGNGRDRMTIAHEIAHLFLLCVFGIKLARSFSNEKVPAYMDPEWQAKCLAGEFMMDARLIKGMCAEDIEIECGVSRDAALTQLSKIR